MRAALLLAVLLLAGCAEPSPDAGAGPAAPGLEPPVPSPGPTVPGQGPAWSFTALDGKTYSRDEPAGNATVLFFMATWCGTCRTRAPIVAEAAAEYADRGVRTYSLDFDPSESAEDIRAWQERYAQPWPHGIDPQLRIQRTFEVRAQSSVVVLDARGNVVEHFGYGKVTEQDLRAALDRALAAPAA